MYKIKIIFMNYSQKEIETENFKLFDGYIHIWLEGKEKIYPFTNVMEINVEKYEGEIDIPNYTPVLEAMVSRQV